jgi:hypothetical protein
MDLARRNLRRQKFLVNLSFLEFNIHLVIFELEMPDDLNLKFVQFLKKMVNISKFSRLIKVNHR